MSTSGALALKQTPANVVARPLLKWAGGKSQLLPEITQRLPEAFHSGDIKRYVEPFVGGGAVFFHLKALRPDLKCTLVDINPELINLYKVVQKDCERLIDALTELESEYVSLDSLSRADMFYDKRERFNKRKSVKRALGRKDVELAALMVFLNRTCFNGLYRLNSTGGFNVPHGRYSNPRIADTENIRAVSQTLDGVELLVGSYQSCRARIRKGTFVYFDPPYRPLSPTAGFVAYERNGFNDDDQQDLAKFFSDQSEKIGVYAMLSNSDPTFMNPKDVFFDKLYKGFTIARVSAIRNINSKGSGRGAVSEILVTSYSK